MEISLLEKWPNFTNISGKFVINDDVIKMTDDQKKNFFHVFKKYVGKNVPTPSPQPFNVQKNPNQNMVNLIVSDQYYPVTSLQVHKTS